ncbi:Accessory protein 7b [Caenorhabditis elegans]|uniref:Accessory protein 7b n=2 Tax=Caenorhabditis elegans TaxID=6239 RepID=G4SN91_CAEEL|nr:Accessory protein 7b [Caenorhabditis elegans]CCD72842.1 Accessory protein 7b [Caenorhabditis elegans]|eukprot:NP_001041289.1 Uncharacterized protein CELE_T22E5.1 [Caenorhabditis elegans]
MSPKFITLLLIACLFAGVCSKFIAMIDRAEVDPEETIDLEEDRKVCFCCRAFVCRHQLCPCSRFTALF